MTFLAQNKNYLTQATWFIDPVNGSDGYTGLVSAFSSGNTGPIKTYAELARRWGTYSPRLRQNTTITFVNSQVDNSDPVYFNPYIENGAIVILKGTLVQTASGTIGSFTAKARATPTLNIASLPAGAAIGNMVVNSTHPSTAWVYKAVSSNFSFTQPLITQTVPIAVPNFFPGEVVWSSGDSVTCYQPTKVNLVQIKPTMEQINSAATSQSLWVFQLSASGFGTFNAADVLDTNQYTNFIQCSVLKAISFSGPLYNATVNFQINNYFVNVYIGKFGPNTSESIGLIGGCVTTTLDACNVLLDADIILGSNASNMYVSGEDNEIGFAYVESNLGVFGGLASLTNIFYGSPILWGPGSLAVDNAAKVLYTNGTAVATFLLTGGLIINGSTTASAYNPAGIGTYVSGISLTPTNLDAAISAGGFGGTAIVPGSGTIGTIVNPTAYGTLSFVNSLSTPTITQSALASTSAGSGATGQLITISAQPGQPATGASNNGGAGGTITISSGAGGTSGSATAGAGGNINLALPTTGSATQGTNYVNHQYNGADFLHIGYGLGGSSNQATFLLPASVGGSNTGITFQANASNNQFVHFISAPSGGLVLFDSPSVNFRDASGNDYIDFTPALAALMQFNVAATTSATINQANNTTNNGTGVTLTIQAQNAAGTGTTAGGPLVLKSGTGTTAGNISLATGGTTQMSITPTSINILSNQTVLNSSGTHNTTNREDGYTATNSTPGIISTFALAANTTYKVSVSLNSQDQSGDGYAYAADYSFLVSRASNVNSGNAQMIQGTTTTTSPIATNINSFPSANTMTSTISLATNTLNINVIGFSTLTTHWSCVSTLQLVS